MSGIVKVDTSQIDAVARRFGLSAEQVPRVQYMAINRIAEKAQTRSRRMIVAQVNLPDAYVRARMWLTKASEGRPVAIISARRRATTLASYGAKQMTVAAKRAKGDARRNIAAGRKQAGISVLVSRANGRKPMRGAFFMPLRAGKIAAGNGMGVFIREGANGEPVHLYGPSVDQVFSGVIDDIVPEIRVEFETEMTRLATLEIRKSIK
jgi:hypothetical protein